MKQSYKKQRWRVRVLLTVGLVLPAAWACGPSFPNWLLNRGDRAVLAAPLADFFREVARLKPVQPPRFQAAPPPGTYANQTAEAALDDLRAALEHSRLSEAERAGILREHAASRGALQRQLEVFVGAPRWPRAGQFDPPPVAEGLPPEFADYFRGSLAFHQGQTNEARAIWSALLARPETERPFRSTWAAFMLGKLELETDPKRASAFFQQVRRLAGAGFADSLGLAAASYGWEGRAWLKLKDYTRAIERYADHLAAGDTRSAGISLRITAAQACREGEEALRPLVEHPLARRVITAYLVSRFFPAWLPAEERDFEPVRIWLHLLEGFGIEEVELAGQLALAAYQAGHFDLAQRWLDRSEESSPLTCWLRAKLELRAGQVEEAAAWLARVVQVWANQAPDELDAVEDPAELAARLSAPGDGAISRSDGASAPSQVWAELGVIRLHRREFVESLDALLRSGFWMDAAYVAERVLTLDELKGYVDRHWGVAPPDFQSNAESGDGFHRPSRAAQFESIRHLLARRLARAGRDEEANPYFPPVWREEHQELRRLLSEGRRPFRPAMERARSLWEAARTTRTLGMELLGTEVGPDWAVHRGNFENGITPQTRQPLENHPETLAASDDELRRATRHEADPPKRFHYRYVAAEIAWEASELMPDNDDETARLLWEAGSWLKHRDPKAADRFYKALVLRCGQTELGQVADKLRWFPPLDEEGRPFLPPRPGRNLEAPQPFNWLL